MPRLSPWDTRIPNRPQRRTLTVPLPELETELVLQEATDGLLRGQIRDYVDNYCALYVARPGGKPRQILQSPSGRQPASREFFQELAAAEVMQLPNGEGPMDMAYLLGIAVKLPERWREVNAAVALLTNTPEQVQRLVDEASAVDEGLAVMAEGFEVPLPVLEDWLGKLGHLGGEGLLGNSAAGPTSTP